MPNVGIPEGVRLRGGPGYDGAVVAGGIAVLPLIGEAGRVPRPGAIRLGQRLAGGRGPGHRRRGDDLRRRDLPRSTPVRDDVQAVGVGEQVLGLNVWQAGADLRPRGGAPGRRVGGVDAAVGRCDQSAGVVDDPADGVGSPLPVIVVQVPVAGVVV